MLERLARRDPKDIATRRLLAHVRTATGQFEQSSGRKPPVPPLVEPPALVGLTAAGRSELGKRVRTALARSYLNLGVMQAQEQRFRRAAELFEEAAGVDADFPQLQSSLGVAYFNAGQFEKACGPLSRAHSMSPTDGGLKRMLAMAWLNTDAYDKAVELLRGDAELESNPSLQFAYALALVRSERAAEAEPVFSRLLREHGDSAELSVLIGQAHAQQGDFAAATEALERAVRLKPDVPEANGALGVIYLKQGKLPEAEAALRAELRVRPADSQSRLNLAYVLDALQRPEEALPLLRELVRTAPAPRRRALHARPNPSRTRRHGGGGRAPRGCAARRPGRRKRPLPARQGLSAPRADGGGRAAVRALPPAQGEEVDGRSKRRHQ